MALAEGEVHPSKERFGSPTEVAPDLARIDEYERIAVLRGNARSEDFAQQNSGIGMPDYTQSLCNDQLPPLRAANEANLQTRVGSVLPSPVRIAP
jgi:hypothetical protein